MLASLPASKTQRTDRTEEHTQSSSIVKLQISQLTCGRENNRIAEDESSERPGREEIKMIMMRPSGIGASFAAAAVAVVLLLGGAGPAHAGTVITNMEGSNATWIENLDIGGELYDVEFIESTAMDLYGDFSSPTFPFVGTSKIDEANEAILAALNGNPAVETAGPNASNTYSFGQDKELLLDPIVLLVQGTYISGATASWQDDAGSAVWEEPTTYADFTIVPAPSTAALSTAALMTLGLLKRVSPRRRRSTGRRHPNVIAGA
jgi:hypothetical protein